MRKTISILLAALALSICANAQNDTKDSLVSITISHPYIPIPQWQHNVALGIGTGASSPIPIPNRISEMSWTPRMCFLVGYDFSYRFWRMVGLKTGLQIKHVGMSAEAKVYQMFTQAIVDESEVSGYFTGYNETVLHATYISLPLQFSFYHKAWKFDAGLFAALKLQGHFSGAVKSGYIRIGDPTGEKVEVGYEPFDFSEFIAPFNYGLEFTATRNFGDRWSAWFDLSWALNSTFKEAFRGLEYKMYNIYGLFGVGYKL